MKSNVKRIARLEIPGGGQVVVQGNYAYIGHMNPPHGHFIPEPTGGFSSPQSNDVDVESAA